MTHLREACQKEFACPTRLRTYLRVFRGERFVENLSHLFNSLCISLSGQIELVETVRGKPYTWLCGNLSRIFFGFAESSGLGLQNGATLLKKE